MESFSLIGNAAAVPIIVGITQLLKKNFSFRYKSDMVSLIVSLLVCPLWWFWHTPELEIAAAVSGGVVVVGKFVMGQTLVAIATYMAASKSYDMFFGNKKRTKQHVGEKQELYDKIAELEHRLGGEDRNAVDDSPEKVDRLRQILER